jgi:hypothetical protein
MRNVSDKRCKKNQNILCSITFFFFLGGGENLAIYEIMRENIVEPGRPQMTKWRMRIACWILNSTITHSVYVILIDF